MVLVNGIISILVLRAAAQIPMMPALTSDQINAQVREIYHSGNPGSACDETHIDSSQYELIPNWDSRLESYAFVLEPQHHCWKTFGYLFQLSISPSDTTYYNPVNPEEFQKMEETRAGGQVRVSVDWIVSPEISPKKDSIFWVLDRSSYDLDEFIAQPSLFHLGKGKVKNFSEVGYVKIVGNKALLLYTQFGGTHQKETLEVIGKQVQKWATQIAFKPHEINEKKWIKVNWLKDIITGPEPEHDPRFAALGKTLMANLQADEDQRMEKFWPIFYRSLPIFIGGLLTLLGVYQASRKKP